MKKILLIFILISFKVVFSNNKVFLAKGLFYEYYQIKEALSLLGINAVIESNYKTIQGGRKLVPHFPENLNDFKLLILANVDTECFDVFERKEIHDFVENGGSLLYIGGLYSLGKGKLEGTFLLDILPVDIVGKWDMICQLSLIKPTEILKDIKWDEEIYVLYYQKVKLKKNSKVLIECNSEPCVILGKYGKGKVCVITLTPLGEFPFDKKPFYKSNLWLEIMKFIIKNLME